MVTGPTREFSRFCGINACVQHRHTEISRVLHDAIPRTEVDCDLRGEGDTADASAEDWRLKSEYCERLHRLRVPDSNVRLYRTTVHVIPRCTISTRPNAGSSRVGVTEFRCVYRCDATETTQPPPNNRTTTARV